MQLIANRTPLLHCRAMQRVASMHCTCQISQWAKPAAPPQQPLASLPGHPPPRAWAPLTRHVHTKAQPSTTAATSSTEQPPTWQIAMLHDGDCPLCEREVEFLKSKDAGRGAIKFVDIAAADYTPADNAGISYEDAMGKIHGILPDGTIVTGVEVFRRLYEAVGLGWVYAATRNAAVAKVANAVYDVWAAYRLQVTGRPGLEQVLLDREKKTCADTGKGQ